MNNIKNGFLDLLPSVQTRMPNTLYQSKHSHLTKPDFALARRLFATSSAALSKAFACMLAGSVEFFIENLLREQTPLVFNFKVCAVGCTFSIPYQWLFLKFVHLSCGGRFNLIKVVVSRLTNTFSETKTPKCSSLVDTILLITCRNMLGASLTLLPFPMATDIPTPTSISRSLSESQRP